MREAIVLAGGFGTRLQSVVNDVPKPMALVNGRPFLQYLLDYLVSFDYTKVVLSVGYKHEVIVDYFGDSYKGMALEYAVEHEPLGTGGGIAMAMTHITAERALVLNGDTFFKVNPIELEQFHKEKQAEVTLSLLALNDVSRYGTVEIEGDNVKAFAEKQSDSKHGLINGGVYIINADFFKKMGLKDKFSFEKDCLELFVNTVNIAAYITKNYFIDIGIPDDYMKVQDDFKQMQF